MQKGALDQSVVIGGDVVHRRVVLWAMVGAAYPDDWHANLGQHALDLAVVEVGNYPVPQPLFNIVEAGTEIFLNKDVPL